MVTFFSKAGLVMAALMLAACAGPQVGGQGRVVDRLPQPAAQPAVPQLPKLTQDDIVRLSKEGLSAESIISRLKETSTRFRLSATEILSLKAKGVATPVLDHLLDSDRQALLDECSERINRLQQDHVLALRQQDALCWHRCNVNCPPWPMHPYPWRRW